MNKAMHAVTVIVLAFIVGFMFQANSGTEAQGDGTRWEYSILVWDIAADTFGWNTSVLYESAPFGYNVLREEQEALFDGLNQTEGWAILDYLAAMGLVGYELVTIDTLLPDNTRIFYFRRELQ